MKQMQRTVALVLALVVVMAAFSTGAFAASRYRVATLKEGTWYKVRSSDYANTIYKLALSTDSIVTVNWKGNKYGEACLYLYTNTKCDDSIAGFIDDEAPSGSAAVGLAKGTYYIRMYEYEDRPTTQVKVNVQKAVNQSNYCRAKAVNLKPNKTVKIAQTADYCYDRWYRIALNSKKTVTITTNEEMAECITLYDSRMQEIDCTSGSRKVITEDPIKKGSYFIRLRAYPVGEYVGTYITLSWN